MCAQPHVPEVLRTPGDNVVIAGVVSMPHGWGHGAPSAQLGVAAERPGASINSQLDDQRRDPLSGNAVLGGVAIAMQAAVV